MKKILIKFRKILVLILIVTLLLERSVIISPFIFAQEAVPTAPIVPTAPEAPKAPSVPTVPAAPTAPTTPSQPSIPAIPAESVSPTTAVTPTTSPSNSPQVSPTVIVPVSPSSGGESANSSLSFNYNTEKNSSGGPDDPANTFTGPSSTNSASEKNQNWEETLNKNLAELNNKLDAISSTGFNSANFNTLSGEVFTGDAEAKINLLNKLNSNMTGSGTFSVFNIYDTYIGDIIFQFANSNASGSFENASGTVSTNSVTGPMSGNNTDISNAFTVKEANGNDAKIINDIDLVAITGKNSASYNTGNSTVKTGNAFALGNIINLVNTNLKVNQWLIGVVNIFGTLAGNIVLPKDNKATAVTAQGGSTLVQNAVTGEESTNNSTIKNEETVSFESINSANIANDIEASANTGENSSSFNTGGGNVTTGTSNVAVSDSTIANTNVVNEEGTVWLVIVNEAGKWVGHILGAPWEENSASNGLSLSTIKQNGNSSVSSENTVTGAFSDNSNSLTSSSDKAVNSSNTATIENNIKAVADTGNNEASYNTGAGEITTGNAKVGLNLLNMVNTNVVAQKFVAVLVNVMGTFLGDVIPPDQQNNYEPNRNIFAPVQGYLPSNFDDFSYRTGGSVVDNLQENAISSNYVVMGETAAGLEQQTILETDNNDSSITSNTSSYSTTVRRTYYTQGTAMNNSNRYLQLGQTETTDNIIVKRGLFLSPAFAKATETSFAGILLGGATFKVSESWLFIIPFTFLFLLFRRRKIHIKKYLNNLLEIIL